MIYSMLWGRCSVAWLYCICLTTLGGMARRAPCPVIVLPSADDFELMTGLSEAQRDRMLGMRSNQLTPKSLSSTCGARCGTYSVMRSLERTGWVYIVDSPTIWRQTLLLPYAPSTTPIGKQWRIWLDTALLQAQPLKAIVCTGDPDLARKAVDLSHAASGHSGDPTTRQSDELCWISDALPPLVLPLTGQACAKYTGLNGCPPCPWTITPPVSQTVLRLHVDATAMNGLDKQQISSVRSRQRLHRSCCHIAASTRTGAPVGSVVRSSRELSISRHVRHATAHCYSCGNAPAVACED